VGFGQQSQGDSPQQGEALVNQIMARQPAGNTQGQQVNRPWHSGQNYWRLAPHGPLQNFTFAWVDEASRNSGMTLAPADPALRAHLSLGKNEGLIVTAIDRGSSAAAVGIHQNDVLLRLGEEESRSVPLSEPGDLEKGLKAAGDAPVSLVLLRAGRRMTIKVQPRVRVSLGPVRPESPAFWIGVSAAPVEPALRTQLQIPPGQGLMILEVHKDSPAARAGIRPHDIFLTWDGAPLSDQAGLMKLVQSQGEKPAKLELLREGHKQEIQITPQRRTTPVTLQFSEPKTGQFDVVLPGAILSGQEAQGGDNADQLAGQFDLLVARQIDAQNQILLEQGATPKERSTEQRLDDLSAQIKELRQAVEALAKAQEKK
jgi:membrane-associated protease RseP (regulator of RpoE activity)